MIHHLSLRTALVALALAASVSTTTLLRAQQEGPPGGGRGNFDPEQMRARMMERYRETLEVSNDQEWTLIEERIQKVQDARRDVGFGGGFGRMFRPPGGRENAGGDQGQRRARMGGEPSPEAEELQKAIDAKASSEELKTKLAKYRESRKAKQAKLQAAQEDLRKVLSVRQEATAVLLGLLD